MEIVIDLDTFHRHYSHQQLLANHLNILLLILLLHVEQHDFLKVIQEYLCKVLNLIISTIFEIDVCTLNSEF